MGIQINGNTDTISAIDGGLNVSGASLGSASASSLNISGIVTASGGFSGNVTGNINSSGVSTFNNVTVGGATTALVVNGNARITGILTVGTGSITINPTTDSISGVTTLGVTTAYISAVNDGPISGARNRIINGAMETAQRGISATYAGTSQNQSTYNTIDRFAFASYGTYPAGTYATVAQIADAPVGFSSCLRVTANQTLTVGSSNARGVWVSQAIEGSNFVDLWNKPITVSFWVKTSNVGTYSLAFTGTGSTAGYATSYTVNSANTWEYKSVTLTHSTSLYTPDRSNGVALTLVFGLLGDATWIGTATANQWVSANIPYLHGCKNLFDTLNATWQITGVQLEAGTVATPFERRSYGQELALCQRYYEYGTASASGWCKVTSIFDAGAVSSINFKTTKRIPPTLATPSLNAGVYPNLQNFNVPRYEGGFSRGFRYTDENQTSFWNVTTGSGGSNDVCGFALVWTASCEL